MAMKIDIIDQMFGFAEIPFLQTVPTPTCRICKSSNLLEDYETGDCVCTNCGAVASERAIAFDETDYRCFADDDDTSKQHYGFKESMYSSYITLGTSYTPELYTPGPKKQQIVNGRTLHRNMQSTDEDFLRQGCAEIKRIVHSFTQGTILNDAVVKKAQKYFTLAYVKQMDQKAGKTGMDATGKQRQHLARHKQFLVAAIWKACQDDIDFRGRFSLDTINSFLSGKPVSKASVTKALKFIGVW